MSRRFLASRRNTAADDEDENRSSDGAELSDNDDSDSAGSSAESASDSEDENNDDFPAGDMVAPEHDGASNQATVDLDAEQVVAKLQSLNTLSDADPQQQDSNADASSAESDGGDEEEIDYDAGANSAKQSQPKTGPPAVQPPKTQLRGAAAMEEYRRKLKEDPAFTPSIGKFWGHDDRFSGQGRGRGRGGFRGGANGRGGRGGRGGPSSLHSAGAVHAGAAGATALPASTCEAERDVSHEAAGSATAPVASGFFSRTLYNAENDPTEKQWVHDKYDDAAPLRPPRTWKKHDTPRKFKPVAQHSVQAVQHITGPAGQQAPAENDLQTSQTQEVQPKQSKRYLKAPRMAVADQNAEATANPNSSASMAATAGASEATNNDVAVQAAEAWTPGLPNGTSHVSIPLSVSNGLRSKTLPKKRASKRWSGGATAPVETVGAEGQQQQPQTLGQDALLPANPSHPRQHPLRPQQNHQQPQYSAGHQQQHQQRQHQQHHQQNHQPQQQSGLVTFDPVQQRQQQQQDHAAPFVMTPSGLFVPAHPPPLDPYTAAAAAAALNPYGNPYMYAPDPYAYSPYDPYAAAATGATYYPAVYYPQHPSYPPPGTFVFGASRAGGGVVTSAIEDGWTGGVGTSGERKKVTVRKADGGEVDLATLAR
ncbi:hypothetical protein HDU86_002014 [Geranomyces michiganensis]|nr:hypothetical protein HDU86_002014 [Geranomyces michiganensis]